MHALKFEEDSFEKSVERMTRRVAEAARELERLKWLAEDLDVRALLPVECYQRFLTGKLHWPGQRERAVAALTVHEDPLARKILAEWDAPESLELLKRVAMATRAEELR